MSNFNEMVLYNAIRGEKVQFDNENNDNNIKNNILKTSDILFSFFLFSGNGVDLTRCEHIDDATRTRPLIVVFSPTHTSPDGQSDPGSFPNANHAHDAAAEFIRARLEHTTSFT